MKFEYKTAEEISKMSAPDQNKYLADKTAHETEVRKNEIETAKTEVLDAAKSAIAEALKTLPEGVRAEDFATYKTELEEQFKNLEKAMGKTAGQSEVVDAIKSLTGKYQNLYEKANDAEVVNEINAVREKHSSAKFEVEHKAWADTNIHSVGAEDTTQPVSDLYQAMASQIIGRYVKPKPLAPVMDQVSVHPLNAATLVIFEDKTTGSFAITEECEEKPWVRYEEKDVSADAEIVTALWCTTNKLRRFYPEVANRMRQAFETLLMETIPGIVMSYINTNASAFTAVSGLTFTAPGDYEAIVAMVTALRKLGYTPGSVIVSPIAYAKLITTKTVDGVYTLQNGASIVLVGDRIILGTGNEIRLIQDPTLANDAIIVGDLSVVHVGVDSQLLYLETDGRVDGEETIKTGLAVNVRTHELGKYVAVLMADGAKAGIIKDTFTNVKTLITTAQGGG